MFGKNSSDTYFYSEVKRKMEDIGTNSLVNSSLISCRKAISLKLMSLLKSCFAKAVSDAKVIHFVFPLVVQMGKQ